MLREWLREVLSSAKSVTVNMDRVPVLEFEKVFQDWPTTEECAAAALNNPALQEALDAIKIPAIPTEFS